MTEFWKCDGCGNVIGGHFRDEVEDEKTGKSTYVVECPTCGRSSYKTDKDIEHDSRSAYKRWGKIEEKLRKNKSSKPKTRKTNKCSCKKK